MILGWFPLVIDPFRPDYYRISNHSRNVYVNFQKGLFDDSPDKPATYSDSRSNERNGSATTEKERKKLPPQLEIIRESLSFKDENGNQTINAQEACEISFAFKNIGKGDANNLKAVISVSGSSEAIRIPSKQVIPSLRKGEKQTCVIPFHSGVETQNGSIVLRVEIEEPDGFNSQAEEIEIETKALIAPEVKVMDFTVTADDGSSNLVKGKPFSIQLLIQNIGKGTAKDVEYSFICPDECVLISGELRNSFESLKPGETKLLELQFILQQKYADTKLNIKLQLTEKLGKYANDWTETLLLNQTISTNRMVIQSKGEEIVDIEVASLRSDVDKDIPQGLPMNEKRYALIIGNEDYSKYQPGLDKEVNVAFAMNDANVFAEYARKTLGVPEKHIFVLLNATKGQMTQELERLKLLMSTEKGDAEVIFYYSGHGLPEESDKTPYLIPVDVSGVQPSNGLALQEVYNSLSAHPSKRVTIILDACFSGGARQKELVAMKAVKVRANVETVPSNLVVLASSSGTEASAVFSEKQHGYFTYFLLKELKDSKGKTTLAESMGRIQQNVSREAALIGKKQTPLQLLGPEVVEKWTGLKW
jgi:hypothetical protein